MPTETISRPPDSGGREIDPVLIFVMNLFGGACWGYFKLGQTRKGIAALIIFVALMLPTWCAGSLIVSLIAAIDGYLQARQFESGHRLGMWTFFNGHS
jgi:hypothetical protein